MHAHGPYGHMVLRAPISRPPAASSIWLGGRAELQVGPCVDATTYTVHTPPPPRAFIYFS